MDMVQDIKPISYVKSHAADVLDRINTTHRPMVVTQNGEARAVILDPESYQNMQDTIKLLKLISQSESDLQKGKKTEQREFFAKFEKRFA